MSFAQPGKRSHIARFAALLIIALLAACGGGGGGNVAGGGIGGTGITSGQITGFGSVIVNGQKFEVESGATQITIDDNTNQAQRNLQVGMIVTIEHTNFTDGRQRADKINYRSDARGPVTLEGQTLTVAGEAIIITDQTCVQDSEDQTQCVTGTAGLDLLSTNDSVDICGNRDADGKLRATRVRKMTRSSSEVELRGQVSALNETARTFVLNGVTVDYRGIAVTGGTLADRATVKVKAAQGPVGNVLTATEVKVESPPPSSGGGGNPPPPGSTPTIEVENLVTRFVSAADFDVGTQRVQATSSTRYENGTADDLERNVAVKVRGKRNSSNILVAEVITFRRTVEIEASVSAVNASESSFTVFGSPGVKVTTNSLTTFKDITQIAVGDNVKILAQESSAGVLATRVDRVSSLDEVVLRAPVSTFSSPLFTQLGVVVETSGSTDYSSELGDNVEDQATFFASLATGTIVKTEGSLNGNRIIAEKVEIKLPD